MTFGSKQGAERFTHYLSSKNATRWIENVGLKQGEVTTKKYYEAQVKAEKVAGEEVSTSGNDCKAASGAAGTTFFIVALAPETAGTSLIAAVGWAIGLAGDATC